MEKLQSNFLAQLSGKTVHTDTNSLQSSHITLHITYSPSNLQFQRYIQPILCLSAVKRPETKRIFSRLLFSSSYIQTPTTLNTFLQAAKPGVSPACESHRPFLLNWSGLLISAETYLILRK